MKQIVLTRSVAGNRDWKDYFAAHGFHVYSFPTIEIMPIKPNKVVMDALKNIGTFDWVVITSIEALRTAQAIAKQSGRTLSPRRIRSLGVLGKETMVAARAMGYRVAFRPSRPESAALAEELPLAKKSSVLFLRGSIASRTPINILTGRDVKVKDLVVYRTMLLKDPDPRLSRLLKIGTIDYLTFASPSAIRGFLKRVPKSLHKKSFAIPTVAIGPRVARALKGVGFRDVRVASDPSVKGIAEAMI